MSTITEQPRYIDSSPEWEPEFEHIDWNDIVDAEQDGDFDKLKSLKYVFIVLHLYLTNNLNSVIHT